MILRNLVPFALLLLVISCKSTADNGGSYRNSDALVSFLVNGKHIVISDSIIAGDPAQQTLTAFYSYPNSQLSLNGWTSGATIALMIPMLPKAGSYPIIGSTAANVSVDSNGWVTDAIHGGTLTITQFDSAAGMLSGRFRFSAHQYRPIGSLNDTVLVDSGVLSRVRISIGKN